MYSIYSKEFLEWLNEWLTNAKKGYKYKLFKNLTKEFDIPERYRVCNRNLYRCTDFINKTKEKNERNIIYTYLYNDLHIQLSSWSYDYNFVKSFHKKLLQQKEGVNYIVKYKPVDSDVVLNIDLLCKNKIFWNFLHQNKKNILGYKKGLSKYLSKKYYQSEVILKIKKRIGYENIIALGLNFPNYKEGFIERNYKEIISIIKKEHSIVLDSLNWDDNYWKEYKASELFKITCDYIITRHYDVFSNEYIKRSKDEFYKYHDFKHLLSYIYFERYKK